MKKVKIYAALTIILLFILLSSIAQASVVVRVHYRAGTNTWNWNARVITHAFDVSDVASFSSYLPDVDAVFISYDDQKTITITPGWEYSTANSTIYVRGDASELFTAIVYDLPGY